MKRITLILFIVVPECFNSESSSNIFNGQRKIVDEEPCPPEWDLSTLDIVNERIVKDTISQQLL